MDKSFVNVSQIQGEKIQLAILKNPELRFIAIDGELYNIRNISKIEFGDDETEKRFLFERGKYEMVEVTGEQEKIHKEFIEINPIPVLLENK